VDETLGVSLDLLRKPIGSEYRRPIAVVKIDRRTRRSFNPAHVSNRLNDELRLIVLDEVSTLFSEPKLAMR
jgi:hypothetical protein